MPIGFVMGGGLALVTELSLKGSWNEVNWGLVAVSSLAGAATGGSALTGSAVATAAYAGAVGVMINTVARREVCLEFDPWQAAGSAVVMIAPILAESVLVAAPVEMTLVETGVLSGVIAFETTIPLAAVMEEAQKRELSEQGGECSCQQ